MNACSVGCKNSHSTSQEFLTLDRAAETPAPSTASTKLMGSQFRCQIHLGTLQSTWRDFHCRHLIDMTWARAQTTADNDHSLLKSGTCRHRAEQMRAEKCKGKGRGKSHVHYQSNLISSLSIHNQKANARSLSPANARTNTTKALFQASAYIEGRCKV